MKKSNFPFFRQLDYRDCGPTCLRMVAKFHGKNFSREFLREKAGITRTGVNMAGIADAAESIEMRTMGMRISLETLIEEAPVPFIVPLSQKTFFSSNAFYTSSGNYLSAHMTDNQPQPKSHYFPSEIYSRKRFG
ncbi:MAG: cysteine peptidase family C39 domain-containing protein [Capnocytophaga sp.]|nr:cysteine peptidase family C39 domain-containing protein [Capnocytophaga sp.]